MNEAPEHKYGCAHENCTRFARKQVTFWHPGLGFVDPDELCEEHASEVLVVNAGIDARVRPL